MPVSFRKSQEHHKKNAANRVGTIVVPSGYDLYKPANAGNHQLVILPYTIQPGARGLPDGLGVGDKHFERSYFVHSGFGASGKEKSVCLNKTFGQRCPICEALREEWANVDRENKAATDALKAIGPKPRALYNVFVPDKGTKISEWKGKVQILDVSYHNFTKVLYAAIETKLEIQGREYVEFFADPIEGSVLHVNLVEKKLGGNAFYEAAAFDFDKHGGVPAEILGQALNLDDLLAVETYEAIKAKYYDLEESTEVAAKEEPKKETIVVNTTVPPTPVTTTTAPPVAQEPIVAPVEATKTATTTTAPAVTVPAWLVKGATVQHALLGQVTVLKVSERGEVTVLDKDDEPHKARLSDLAQVAIVSDQPPAAKTEAEPQKSDIPTDDDGSWDSAW